MSTRVFRFTAREKLEEVRRELAMRRRVYPRKVEEGKLKPSKAEAQVAILEAIAADYEAIINQENPRLL